jgi:hypothetical protein
VFGDFRFGDLKTSAWHRRRFLPVVFIALPPPGFGIFGALRYNLLARSRIPQKGLDEVITQEFSVNAIPGVG